MSELSTEAERARFSPPPRFCSLWALKDWMVSTRPGQGKLHYGVL